MQVMRSNLGQLVLLYSNRDSSCQKGVEFKLASLAELGDGIKANR